MWKVHQFQPMHQYSPSYLESRSYAVPACPDLSGSIFRLVENPRFAGLDEIGIGAGRHVYSK